VRIPKIRDFLVQHYFGENRHTAVALLGKPGIGKTTAVEEAAQIIAKRLKLPFVNYTDQAGEELLQSGKRAFIYHNIPMVEHEPSDLTGIPKENSGGFVRFRPLLWAKLMSENPGILLLDDFLDVQRDDLFSVAYKITLERRAGYLALDPGVMVVIAANTPDVSTLSRMMPAPLANRLAIFRADSPTLSEWYRWMTWKYGDNWDKRTFAFLSRFEADGYLCRPPKEGETLTQFPTHRSWTKLALELRNTRNSIEEVAEAFVGPEVGQKFAAFLRVKVDIEQLIENPDIWDRQNLDQRYMLCLELATWLSRAKEKDLPKVLPVFDKISERRQFPVLVFMCLPQSKLEKLFSVLFKERPELYQLVDKVLEDKRAISAGFLEG